MKTATETKNVTWKYNFISFVLRREFFNSFNLCNNGEITRNPTGRRSVLVEWEIWKFTVVCPRSPQTRIFAFFFFWLRSIADSLKAGLEVKAEQYDNVTIFYSDITEFSNITSVSSPIQVKTKYFWHWKYVTKGQFFFLCGQVGMVGWLISWLTFFLNGWLFG